MTALYVPPTDEADHKKQNQSLQLIGGLVSGYESSWTAFTPTVTALTGTFTTVAGAGRYKQNGKTVSFFVTITVTTVGTAGTAVICSLPVTATAAANGVFAGREAALTGFMVQGYMASTTVFYIQQYDATFLGANGSIYIVSGTYEAA